MSYADQVFKKMCQDVLENGTEMRLLDLSGKIQVKRLIRLNSLGLSIAMTYAKNSQL